MSMRVAVTGLNAAQTELSTIANNIANASTTGFKMARTEFADLVPSDASGRTAGSGVRVTGVVQQMKQGGLEYTGNTLDLAINGGGFFVLENAGSADTYTRAGNFRLDKDGYVATGTGERLKFFPGAATSGTTATLQANLPKQVITDPSTTPPTTVDYPVTRLAFDTSGALRATYANGDIDTLGTVALATFPTASNLSQLGGTQWGATGTSGAATVAAPGTGERGLIESGALETSNVEITEQLVDMITAQRNFQANAKTISTMDQVAQAVLNIR
jgi:flagellar hook protein FlgE